MATGNPYFSAVQQTLPEYIPMPLNELAMAGQVIQNRYDTHMQQLDQTAQGIGSIQASLPGHREYVQEFSNNFNQESEALLEKYNNNAADPNFGRDLRRLTMKYTNDPNIRTIQQANALYLQKQEDLRKLSVDGKRFIDSNINPTGIDSQGNLTADVGSVRATNFQDNIRTKFRDTLQAKLNDGRGSITNEQAVQGTINSFVNFDDQGNITGLNTNDPDVRDALMYYTNQGYDTQGAANQILTDLQREAQSSTMYDRDYQYDRLLIERRRLNIAEGEYAMKLAEYNNSLNNFPTINIDYSSVKGVKNVKESKLSEISNIERNIDTSTGNLKEVDAGNMGMNKFEWTPENEELLNQIGGWEPINPMGGPTAREGVDIPRHIRAKVPEGADLLINQKQREQIEYMRNELGLGNDITDSDVISKYKEIVNSNSYLPTAIRFNTEGIGEALTSIWGLDLDGAILQEGRGFKPINTRRLDINDFKDNKFTEVLTAEIPGLEGEQAVMRFTANHNGKQVNYYKPLPSNLARLMPFSLAKSTAVSSGMTNQEMLDINNGAAKPVLDNNTGQVRFFAAPQNYGNEIKFAIIDPDGEPVRNSDGSLRYLDNTEVNNAMSFEERNLDNYSKTYRSTVRER